MDSSARGHEPSEGFADFREELWKAQSRSELQVNALQSTWGRKVNWALRTGLAVGLACIYAANPHVHRAEWQNATVFSCVLAIGAVSGPSLGATIHHATDIVLGSALGALASTVLNESARLIQPRWLQMWVEIVLFLFFTFWVTSRKGGIGFKRCAVGVMICGALGQKTASGYEHSAWYPWTVLVPCIIGPAAALVSMILPWPCFAVVELRHRLAFQALIGRAVLCEQYEAMSNKTVSAVTIADQLGETIRDDFARIKELLHHAAWELWIFPSTYERLELLVKLYGVHLQLVRGLQTTLRKSPSFVSVTHSKFFSFTDPHWRVALKACSALLDDVVAAEQGGRHSSEELQHAARQAKVSLLQACEDARREVVYKGGSQYSPPEPGESRAVEHCRRIAQHYYMDQLLDALSDFCEKDSASIGKGPRWALRCNVRANLLCLVEKPSIPEMKQAFKKTVTMAILLVLPYVDILRQHNEEYVWAQLGAAFVFQDYVGSAVVTGMHRMVGTLIGGIFTIIVGEYVDKYTPDQHVNLVGSLILVAWVIFWSFGKGSAAYGYLCTVTAFSAAIMFVGALEAPIKHHAEGEEVMIWRMKQLSQGTGIYVIVELLLWPNSARRTLFDKQAEIIGAIRSSLVDATAPYSDVSEDTDSESEGSDQESVTHEAPPASDSGVLAAIKDGNALVAASVASLTPADSEPSLKRRHFPRSSYERVLRTESRMLRIIGSLHTAVRSVEANQVRTHTPEVVKLVSDYAEAASVALSATLVKANSHKGKRPWFPDGLFSYDPSELIEEGKMGKMPSAWEDAARAAAPMLAMKDQDRKLRAGMEDYLDRVATFADPGAHPNALAFSVQTTLFCLLQCTSHMDDLGERLRPIRSEDANATFL